MSRVKKIISSLRKQCEDSDGNIDGSKISYNDINEAFKIAGVKEKEVFDNLRTLIISEIAYGVGLHLSNSGPERKDNTLQYEGITALVQLFNEVLKVQKYLEDVEK